jgi:mRNA interferase MazF
MIVQSDAFNNARISTVTVVALTSNIRLVDAPGNVLVPSRSSGLSRDSVANVAQVLTIDRSLLIERVGRLTRTLEREIDEGLRLALGSLSRATYGRASAT